MQPLDEARIRASFVNLPTDAEADTLPMPWGLPATLWEELDYLGWVDPAAPERGYLVAETPWGVVGVRLRLPKGRAQLRRRQLCNLCRTQHPGSGAALMVAPRAGAAGRHHNTIGTYVCADLACSLYVRGLRRPRGGGSLPETLDVDARVARLRRNLDEFVGRVLGRPPTAD